MKKILWAFLPSLLFSAVTEERAVKDVYAHLMIRDPIAAVDSAKVGLTFFPQSKDLRSAFIQALCEKGDEVEAIEQWARFTAAHDQEKENRMLLETLSWGVLSKGEHSSQLPIRANALLGASFTTDAKAIPILLAQMRGSNAFLRSLAIKMTTRFRDAPLQQELHRLLKEEKVWYVRLEVINAMGQLRMKDARAELKEIVAGPKTMAEEKAAAMIALVSMYDSVSHEELLQLINSNRSGLRHLACEIIAYLDLKEEKELVTALLKDTSSDVRMAALNAIGLLGINHPVNFDDPDVSVAITAAWVGLLQDSEEAEKRLEIWMQDPRQEIRRLASAAVSMSGKRGIRLGWKMLRASKDPYVRVNLAMGQIGERRHLKRAAEEIYDVFVKEKGLLMWDQQVNPLFRSLAPSNVRHVDQIPHYPAVVDQLVRLDLLSLLSIVRFPDAQAALKDFLQHQTWGVTASAAAMLLEEGDEEALALVHTLLNDNDPKIRLQAAFILALFGSSPDAVKILQDAYPEVDREMKVHILEALAHVGDPQSISFLINILKEPFQVLRVVAASALIQCLNH